MATKHEPKQASVTQVARNTEQAATHAQDAAEHTSEAAVKTSRAAQQTAAAAVVAKSSAERTTELAADRTILAFERTYAAWVRTGLVALASGIGARKLLEGVLPEWMVIVTGTILLLFSSFCFLPWLSCSPSLSDTGSPPGPDWRAARLFARRGFHAFPVSFGRPRGLFSAANACALRNAQRRVHSRPKQNYRPLVERTQSPRVVRHIRHSAAKPAKHPAESAKRIDARTEIAHAERITIRSSLPRWYHSAARFQVRYFRIL